MREHLGNDLQPTFFKHWNNKKRYPNAPFYRLNEKQRERIMSQAMKRSARYYWMNVRGEPMDSIIEAFNRPAQMRVFSWKGDIDTIMTPMDSIHYYKYFLQTGIMSVEPSSGYVRAYVGGIDYHHFQYVHVTSGKRQVGSTFKPFVYASAMQEMRYTPCTKVPNIPVTFKMPAGQRDYTPKNSDRKKQGEMITLKWALANSVNFISAYLIKKVGPSKVIEIARNMGVTSEIKPVPAICLGTPSLSVYEMVGALSTFPNKGIFQKPIFVTRIEDKNGNVIETFNSPAKDALDEETAYKMLSLMEGVVKYGTGVRLRYKYKITNPIAGKTGTTDNQSGAEDRSVHFRTIRYGQGANMALPIWALYMKKIYADSTIDISTGEFEKPRAMENNYFDCEKASKQMHNTNGGNHVDEFDDY